MKNYFKKTIQNVAVVLLVLIALKNLLAALPFKFAERYLHFYMNIVNPHALQFHHVFSFLIGAIMLILAHQLYKRVRMAWFIQIVMLSITIVFQFVRYHVFTLPILSIEIFVLAVLLYYHRDFGRKADRITVKKALALIGFSFLLVLLNASVGIFIMKEHIRNIHDIYDALEYSVKLLVFMDTDFITFSGKIGMLYTDSLILINWICIISSVLLILKPIVYNPVATKHDKEVVRRIVLNSGQNPMAYLYLENDKKYLFGKNIEGVCSYQVVNNVFVICGDMICAEQDGFIFLNEILEFCHENAYEILFLNITEHFAELYKMAGFGVIKYGEDACFRLSEYNLAGGSVAKVRAAINHANKAGITVNEYKPLNGRDSNIEQQIADISKEWLEHKNSDELGFMIGGVGLDNPLDRRYFYASDADGKMLGFVVFLPYLSDKGYLADVTRRRNDAPQGVLEKITYDAFMLMKEEGVEWGNLGLSPLYNINDGDRATFTERLFSYVYENMSSSYDFKALHHAKEKYAPTEWQPRYLAYSPRPFSPSLAYAIVRVQAGKNIAKMVISEFKRKKG